MLRHYLTEDEMAYVKQNGFGENGLRYTLDELNAVLPLSRTMEQMADYVDAITFAKAHSNDTGFVRPMLEPPTTSTVNLSATGLGNLAYVALYMPDEECRQKAEALYCMLMQNGTLSTPKRGD
jgi:hypothetical protein